MKNYKVLIAYDGTDYFGWQKQKENPKTIAGELEKCFKEVFGKTITIRGASRTDAGVHAAGQVASFQTNLQISPKKMEFAWQNILPDSMLIRDIQEVEAHWNPRANVYQKTYYYHFFQERVLPFWARYGWYYRYKVDLAKLQESFTIFIGTHDFRSFCTGQEYEDTIRTIHSIEIEYYRRFKSYRIIVKGPGFLRYMIRRIVGAALQVSSDKALSVDYLARILEEKNPEQLLYTAPAKGLLLNKIIYKE